AVLAGGAVAGFDLAAVRRDDGDIVQPQRRVVEVEQVVGDRGIHGDPRRIAGDDGLRRQQPGLVGEGCGRERGGEGECDGEVTLHGVLRDLYAVIGTGMWMEPAQGVIVSATVPSSVSPCALPDCGAVAGQVKGILSSSRPPTSRTASTTSV